MSNLCTTACRHVHRTGSTRYQACMGEYQACTGEYQGARVCVCARCTCCRLTTKPGNKQNRPHHTQRREQETTDKGSFWIAVSNCGSCAPVQRRLVGGGAGCWVLGVALGCRCCHMSTHGLRRDRGPRVQRMVSPSLADQAINPNREWRRIGCHRVRSALALTAVACHEPENVGNRDVRSVRLLRFQL